MQQKNINDIIKTAKNMGVTNNVTLRVIDQTTGKIVQEHTGHNSATNSMLVGIAQHLVGNFNATEPYGLNPAYPLLSNYVPRYISLGTMGLTSQEQDEEGLPTGIGDELPEYEQSPEYIKKKQEIERLRAVVAEKRQALTDAQCTCKKELEAEIARLEKVLANNGLSPNGDKINNKSSGSKTTGTVDLFELSNVKYTYVATAVTYSSNVNVYDVIDVAPNHNYITQAGIVARSSSACILGNTQILTKDGYKAIQDLPTNRTISIAQYNFSTGQTVYYDTTIRIDRQVTNTVRLTFSNGQIFEGTTDQQVMRTNGRYITLGELVELTSTGDYAALKEQLAKLKKQYADLLAQLKYVQGLYNQSKQQGTTAQQLAEKMQELEALKKQLEYYKNMLAKLRREYEQHLEDDKKKALVSGDTEALQAELEDVRNQLSQLQRQYDDLLTRYQALLSGSSSGDAGDETELNSLRTQLAQKQAELDAANSKYNALWKTYQDALKSQSQQSGSSSAELAALQSRYNNLNDDYSSLMTRYNALQNEYDTYKRNHPTTSGSSASQAEIDSLNSQITQLTNDVNTWKTNYNNLYKEYQQHLASDTNKDTQIAQLQRDLTTAQNNAASIQAEYDAHKQQDQNYIKTINSLQEQLNSAGSGVDLAGSELFRQPNLDDQGDYGWNALPFDKALVGLRYNIGTQYDDYLINKYAETAFAGKCAWSDDLWTTTYYMGVICGHSALKITAIENSNPHRDAFSANYPASYVQFDANKVGYLSYTFLRKKGLDSVIDVGRMGTAYTLGGTSIKYYRVNLLWKNGHIYGVKDLWTKNYNVPGTALQSGNARNDYSQICILKIAPADLKNLNYFYYADTVATLT